MSLWSEFLWDGTTNGPDEVAISKNDKETQYPTLVQVIVLPTPHSGKASVSHGPLMDKLCCIGLNEHILCWILNYLSNKLL